MTDRFLVDRFLGLGESKFTEFSQKQNFYMLHSFYERYFKNCY